MKKLQLSLVPNSEYQSKEQFAKEIGFEGK